MAAYQAPLFWFNPQMLRRWLWKRRERLSEETKNALYLLFEDGQDDGDFHAMIRRVILNVDYIRIFECLNQDDFRYFVNETIDLWTDPALYPEWLGRNVLRLNDRYDRLKTVLKRAFGQSSLKPRLCVWGLVSEVERASSLARSSLDLADQAEGIRVPKAQQEIRDSCNTVLERVEKLLDLILQFSALLSRASGIFIDIPDASEWGSKEFALHQTSAELLNCVTNAGLSDDVTHLADDIGRFATICYGTAIKSKKRKEILLPSGDPQPPGQLMLLFSRLRELRNEVAHLTSTIKSDGGLPKGLIVAAKSIEPAASEFTNIIRNETCFPEIVRIISFEQSVNGIELHVVAVPEKRECRVVYPDETLMKSLARDAMLGLACSEGDQDFWLFPAPTSYQAHLLNPLLLPMENHEDYKAETVKLEIAE